MVHKLSILWVILALIPGAVSQAQLIRVPQDVANLQQAIDQIGNGGVIEIAAGTYPAPANGFRMRRLSKAFTVRAAAGQVVVLSGEGTHPIVEIEGTGAGDPEIRFEDLRFEDGFSDREGRGGAVTVLGGRATFEDCTFRDNRAAPPTTGGGAVRVADGAEVRFSGSLFRDNSARTRGGAVEVTFAAVTAVRSRFLGNRVNLPGHDNEAVGGGFYILDSTVRIERSRFEGNQAGWVGGALYAFGLYEEPVTVPKTRLTVVHSTFVGNLAVSHPCCPSPGPSAGGVLHAENQASAVFRACRFLENRSDQGGAISGYRADIEVHESVFRGNAAGLTGAVLPVGGAILLEAADFAGASTDFGAINRPSGSLIMTRTLVQGRFGGTGAAATRGGCLSATGDVNREFGQGGVAQDGTTEFNRVEVMLSDVVFFDCDVEPSAGAAAFGGAISQNLADVTLERSLVLDSDALEAGAAGGGLRSLGDSVTRLVDTTFAGNSAEERGGAVTVAGSRLEVTRGAFLANDVTPSRAEPIQESTGAAIFTIPARFGADPERNRPVTGVVADALFADNVGLPIVESDFDNGPINDLRYDGNRFIPGTFGNDVFLSNLVSFGGTSVNQLNNLVVDRADGTSTRKSQRANRGEAGNTVFGALTAAPSVVLTTAAAGDPPPPVPAFLGFAWRGPAATLGGQNLADRSGIVEVTQPGDFRLRVGGTRVADATVTEASGLCLSGLCLNRQRFQVEVTWRDFTGGTGEGLVVPFGSDDSGLFFFFDPDNWEILVKVLRGCGINNHFWVFSAATTNVEYTLRVTDTATGDVKTYFNPLGNRADAITDTSAFATCDVAAPAAPPPGPAELARQLAELERELAGWRGADEVARPEELEKRVGEQGDCTPGGTNLCLNRGRFRVEVAWEDFRGGTGEGLVVPFGSDDSGLFFFFDPDNWEILVKVLRGCGINGHYWVFSAATTNVEYTLTVTDTETGDVETYFNPLGVRAPAITDTGAFPNCP